MREGGQRADQYRSADVEQFLRDPVEAVRAAQQVPVREQFGPQGTHGRPEGRRARSGERRGGREGRRRYRRAPGQGRQDAQQGAVEHRHRQQGAAGAVTVDQGRPDRHQEDRRRAEQGHHHAGHRVGVGGTGDGEQHGEGDRAVGQPGGQGGDEGAARVRDAQDGGVRRPRGGMRGHADVPLCEAEEGTPRDAVATVGPRDPVRALRQGEEHGGQPSSRRAARGRFSPASGSRPVRRPRGTGPVHRRRCARRGR